MYVRYLLFSTLFFFTFLVTQNIHAQTLDKQDVFIESKSNRAIAPARYISEQLGAEVKWDPQKQQIDISMAKKQMKLMIGSSEAIVNNEVVELDSPPIIVHNRTYVPLRFVSEELGADVRWEAEKNKVVLTFDERTIELDISRGDTLEEYSNDRFQHVKLEQIGENQYELSGQAKVFEGRFQFVVEDGHNELLKGSIQAEAGAPAWGEFAKEITVKKVQPNSSLILILFEESAKDGKRMSELPISL